MPCFSPESLAKNLNALLPQTFAGKLCVAFSGGVDSSVLLHALSALRASQVGWQVRAIHIDHQLQSAAKEWAFHCDRVAAELRVPLIIKRVVVADDPQGFEAAARHARYAALRRLLQADEVLLTAHHGNDQVETALLALLRGSGLQGLAAMPGCKRFGSGWHVRPLLSYSRDSLQSWALDQGISAVEDPSNEARRHDRNFLRHEIVPPLRARWPGLVESIVRTTGHLGEAIELLDELAATDLRICAVDRCLSIDALKQLSEPRRRNVLRYWLRLSGYLAPSTRKLSGLEHDLFNTAADRVPCVAWRGVELRWHRGLLYAEPASETRTSDIAALEWNANRAFDLPSRLGKLSIVAASGPGLAADRLPERLDVRFRSGRERIRLPGRQHRHELSKLLQERDVLPWWRDRLPLIFHGSQLLAVGDLCWSHDIAARAGERVVRVKWDDAPNWKAVAPATRDGIPTRT